MKQEHLIGIDIGTSSCKVVVIGGDGALKYSGSKEYKINYLQSGYVEQDPDDWYRSTVLLVREATSDLKKDIEKIAAIGVSSQSNALVAVDRSGNVLHPAILYLDKRTADICKNFKDTAEEERIYDVTGSPLKPSYTGPQIYWVRKNRDDIYKRTYKFLTANGYIIQKITGNFSHDLTQTGMTGIFDRQNKCWSEEILDYFEIDINKLPEIYSSYKVVGKTSKEFSEASGLPEGIAVVAGSLDVAATMLGSGCIRPGACFIEMGSVMNITVLTDKSINDRNLQTYPCAVPGINIVAGSVDGAGNSIKWFLEEIFRGYKEERKLSDSQIFNILDKEVIKTKIGAGSLLFLPYMAGMRTPRSDLNTAGVFFGLKLSTKKIDIFRSILEGCCYGLRHNLDFILKKNINLRSVIASGGGSRNKFWMQIMSNVLKIDIKRSVFNESSSIGAAMLAGIGCGIFKDFDKAVESVCKYNHKFLPEEEDANIYNKYYGEYINLADKVVVDLDRLSGI